MRSIAVMLAVTCALAASGCTAPPRSHDAPVDAPPPAAASATAESWPPGTAWPTVPQGRTPAGATWQSVRHGTVHVHLAVPAGAELTRATLEFGHPVVRVAVGHSTVEITFSSGTAPFAPGLARDPPRLAGLPLERIARTPDNTTVQYLRQGQRTVLGWVRGAKCESVWLADDDVATVFDLCASLRVPPPGPWRRRDSDGGVPLPPVPQDATLDGSARVPVIYTGHYVARVVPGACPSEAEVREASGADPVAFERPTYPHGPVLVARRTGSYEGERYPAETSVWAARAGHCCIATIGEFFTDATAEQVDDVARLCDATAPATTVAP